MNVFETVADRRIAEARAKGYFDNLAGHGKPIADLDTERPAGWWAARVVMRERSLLRAEELAANIRAAMPPLWRSADEHEARDRIAAVNELIAEYNRTTSLAERPPLNADEVVQRWRELRRRTAER